MRKYKKQVKVGSVKVQKKENESDPNVYYFSLDEGVKLVDRDGNLLDVRSLSLKNPVQRREAILNSERFKGDREKLAQEIESFKKGGKLDFITMEAFASVDD